LPLKLPFSFATFPLYYVLIRLSTAIIEPVKDWVCTKKVAQKNTHTKLKNDQHIDTASSAALACFRFYKRVSLASNSKQ
jgi:hypothetical protein